MKVIVLLSDHTNVYEMNHQNLISLVRILIKEDMCNTEEGFELLDKKPTEKELLDFICDQERVNQRGGQVHILEISPTLTGSYI